MAQNTYNYTTNQNPEDIDTVFGLVGVHPEYLNHYQRWQFLIKSYLGGHEYRLGKYLTRYVYESDSEYLQRLVSTPLDNHVKSVVHTFNSFLYRKEPQREFGSIANNPELQRFMDDADLEGKTFSSFMRDVNIMSTIYGHCLVLLDRPQSTAGTKAEELALDIRTYANIFSPENILDWEFTRLPSGKYELTYLKLLEVEHRAYGHVSEYYVRTFTPEMVTLERFKPSKPKDLEIITQNVNELGKVPAVFVYAQRSPTRGIGVSDIGDIADTQNFISNQISEIEQLIRLQNHPSLVKTSDVDAAAGAGAIITMPPELDGGLKPYLLQPSSQSIDGILSSIDSNIKAIDRMAHMGALRAIETRQMSGVAMMSEFLLLDAKLCEKAKNLELAEEQIWRLWAAWQGEAFDGKISYPMAFHIRDKSLDMDLLKKAAETNPANPDTKDLIDRKIKELLMDDDEVMEAKEMEHPNTTEINRTPHIQEMIMGGYTDEQILELHPEITQDDIQVAKEDLVNSNNG